MSQLLDSSTVSQQIIKHYREDNSLINGDHLFTAGLQKLLCKISNYSDIISSNTTHIETGGLSFSCAGETNKNKKPGLHIHISKEELKLIPLVKNIPFISVSHFNPADILITNNNKCIRAYERKTTTDLGNLIRFREQRKRLCRLEIPQSNITVIHEQNSKCDNRIDYLLQQSCESNVVWRNRFGWRCTGSLFQTLYMILRDFLSVCVYGCNPEKFLQNGKVYIPAPPPKQKIKGGNPSSYTSHSTTLMAQQLSCIPGVSGSMGWAIAQKWPNWKVLSSSASIQLIQTLTYQPNKHKNKTKRKIGPSAAKKIWMNLGYTVAESNKKRKKKKNKQK
jgi:hypothetical protein